MSQQRPAKPPLLYLDNAVTTLCSREAIEAMTAWVNQGSADAGYANARRVREMLDGLRRRIAQDCGFELSGPKEYRVVFTSGAAEANSFIITSAVRAYTARTGYLPHVATSAAEHPSVLGCCRGLAADKLCQHTEIPVATDGPRRGTVSVEALEEALRVNTCLVSITAANHETGARNDLRELSRIAHAAQVPFHTDAAQVFGRCEFRPLFLGADAFSVSFRKLHAPPGTGALVLRQSLISGYQLPPLIYGGAGPAGSAESLRGGAENLPGLAAATVALRAAMTGLAERSARVAGLRDRIWAALCARLPCFPVDAHPPDPPASIDGGITPAPPARHRGTPEAVKALAESEKRGTPVVFRIGDAAASTPGHLLLAVRLRGTPEAVRAELERRGVLVSLTSPGSTTLAAMGVPQALRAALRVCVSDETSEADADAFVQHFVAAVAAVAAAPAPAPAPAPRKR